MKKMCKTWVLAAFFKHFGGKIVNNMWKTRKRNSGNPMVAQAGVVENAVESVYNFLYI